MFFHTCLYNVLRGRLAVKAVAHTLFSPASLRTDPVSFDRFFYHILCSKKIINTITSGLFFIALSPRLGRSFLQWQTTMQKFCRWHHFGTWLDIARNTDLWFQYYTDAISFVQR